MLREKGKQELGVKEEKEEVGDKARREGEGVHYYGSHDVLCEVQVWIT